MLKLFKAICGIVFLMAIVLASFISTIPVSANDSSDAVAIGDVTNPGILPDSGFYFMKSWGRNLQLMFAGTDTEKARLMLKYTNEDALALQKMYQMGKYDVGARQAEQYALQLQNTVQIMEQVRARQGQNASADLVNTLEQNYLKQQEVLLSVIEKTPEAAQNGLLNAIENSNKHVAAMVMAQNGEQALQQYQEQVNQQTNNMGQATKIKVQQRLQATHGQASQSAGSNSSGQGDMTQTQTQTQTMQQTGQQGGQPNIPNQGAGQPNANPGGGQGSGNQKQGK
jgi:hypothetical protein